MAREFEQLINRQSGRIYAIARRYAEIDGIDDLYQEILEQLWRSWKRFRGESKPETWIYRIGFNTAMTSLRKRVRQRKGSELVKVETGLKTVEAGRSEAEILRDFLDSLGEVDASVMMMYLDGLTGQEMAGILGIRVNAIQVRITRMKKTFAKRYLEVK